MFKPARWEKILLCIPVITGLTAGLIYRFQGMTGGGHGNYDFIIGILSLPSIFVVAHLPRIELIWSSNMIAWVIAPAVLNFLLLVIAILTVRLVRRLST